VSVVAVLACNRSEERPLPRASPAASGSAGSGSDAASARPAPPPPDARPASLLDELRALPRDRTGDRADAMARHKRAMTAHGARDFATAEQLWAEAARIDPAWDWPFYNLACVASRVGRIDDALAYLEAVHARKPGFDMLRRIETDHDLDAVRARPALAALIQQIAGDLLVGLRSSFSLPSGDSEKPPALPGAPVSGCTSLELTRDGKYAFLCGAGFNVTGEWVYDGGLIFYQATSFSYSGPEPTAQVLNDQGAVAITYLANGYLCLGDAHPRKTWPTPRKLDRRVPSPEGAMPRGCLQ